VRHCALYFSTLFADIWNFSPARLSLAFLPKMVERGRGEIVNVSSMGVHSAAFGVGAYSASKCTNPRAHPHTGTII
jgi:short-subunit dehydrogenase